MQEYWGFICGSSASSRSHLPSVPPALVHSFRPFLPFLVSPSFPLSFPPSFLVFQGEKVQFIWIETMQAKAIKVLGSQCAWDILIYF